MNSIIKSWLLALLVLGPTGNAISEEIAVIVNPAYDASTLDKNEVRRIYMGQSTMLKPYDLPETSRARNQFYKTTTGRNFRQIKALWAKLVFSGRARAPEELISEKALKRVIASDQNGIGYIENSKVDDTVKVVMILKPEE